MTNVLDPERPSRQSLLHFDRLSISDPGLRRHDHRIIHCNISKANAPCNFKGNSISTTKYNLLTFLPKGLFEQFRRVANLYFLTISILSSTPVSPIHPVTNLLPLTLVLLVSLIKEAIEDWKRYKSDKIINSTMIEVLDEGRWVQKPWSNLAVGDIVKVRQDNYFPADLLFLASTNEDGICYIETSNLDGETNLKIGKALERTWDYIDAGIACKFFGEIECEQPNNSLYTFTGNLVMGKQVLPLSPGQILLRGCSLRNTEYIVGVTIFAGHETKVMMNAMDAPSKRSTLERRLDKVILILFGVLFIMCLVGALGSGTFVDYKYWYLGLVSDVQHQFDPNNRFSVASLTFFTFVTLFSTIIPISLYVSIEMIKFVQSTQFINRDQNMYHSESNIPALARTSNLNEELGQIEYIFSDKTGTLTQNVMEFLKCSIAGVMYGNGVTEVERTAADQSGTVLQPSNAIWEKGFNFDDVRLMKGAWRNELRPDICIEFFRCLAICHTVLPEGDETTGKIVYQAASPDESALVTAAKNFGFFFYRRTQTTIRVRESHVKEEHHVEDVEYQILNVLEFNSNRKRQSVICRYPTGRLVLYCKGADDVIYERLAKHENPFKYATLEHLERFGADGLRSLCLAFRELDHSLYEAWNEKFIQAQTSLHDREKKLDEVAELIEVDLILIGCTAIEDKLQEGVPKCIEMLSKAGIKIWVLTGDKVETAINIAYACSLMNNEMKQFIIKSDIKQLRQLEANGNTNEVSHAIEKNVKTELELAYREAENMIKLEAGLDFALVIDGRCLTYALGPDICGTLLKLSMMCKAVLCCRVSPLQKAQVTKLIKDSAEKITLSVGDGANDVSMIQAAHIGVGISGQEGMQAVMASDFSIAQFRFLTDLLLVHGRWSYIRISKVVLYCFYKNFVFTLTQFWFNMYTGFSGQRFYDDWYQSLYNVLFSALPVIVLGIFEKDVNASVSKQYPQLYKAGIDNAFFKWRELLVWALFAVYQSLVLFYFPVSSHNDGKNSQGRILGLWDAGTMAFTFVVITVNLRLLMSCNYITRWHHISIGGSIIAWFLFSFLYGGVRMGQRENVFQVIYVITSTWYFWFSIILVPATALLLDFLYQSLQRWFSPYDYQILQEVVQEKQLQPWGKLSGKGKLGALAHPAKQPSRNTGYSFDSPAYESFFASEQGVQPLLKPWDVACRHSLKVRCPTKSCTHEYKPPKSSL